MKTEFKDVAHLYLGCMLECHPKHYEDKAISGRLDGIVLNRAHVQCFDVFGKPWSNDEGESLLEKLPFPKIKPILRPLSDMSNEEIKELQEMGYSLSFPLQRILDENGDELRMDVFDLAELTLWLTSKSFDICNLIESGQAIDKTTLSQPEREEGK